MGTSKGYLPPTGFLWKETKRSITNMVKNNFQRDSIGKAMSNFSNIYNNGNNGGRRSSGTIASSGARAVGFLKDAKDFGFNDALNKAGLAHLIGKDSDEVYIGLLDYFAGDGSTLNKSIVRDSMSELLKEQFLDVSESKEYDEIISNMDINKFISDFIIKFIQKSFLTNFSEKIEGLCKNLDEYIKAEKDIKEFIRIEIERNYSVDDINNINWTGKQGKDFIMHKCNEAYEIFSMWKGDIDENMD